MSAPLITKELLRELGDWRAEKLGRELAATGAVLEWHWEPPFLTGIVRSQGVPVRAKLKLGPRGFDCENLCACKQARVEGIICAHVMALVFATIPTTAKPVAKPMTTMTAPFTATKSPITKLNLDGAIAGLLLQTEPADAADASLLAAGFERRGQYYRLAGETRVGQFLANTLPVWQTRWPISFGPQLTQFLAKCDRVQPEVTATGLANNWLALDLAYQAGQATLSSQEVQRLLQTGAAHQRLHNGRFALLPADAVKQFQDVIFDCDARQEAGKLCVERRYAPYLAEAVRDAGFRGGIPTELHEVAPLRLPDYLRPYQRVGVQWLHWLAASNLAGILADEMGLGKTLQALIWLQSVKPPALIICPTSLLANWQAEVERFTPEQKTLIYHGADRELTALPDIVITSYALLRRDVAALQRIEWGVVVLDEAQHIKNRFSQVAQAVKTLHARHRLVLTGTPLENSLADLWSIFDFLMPGYLGPAKEFRDRYELPIQQRDAAALRRLHQRLRPFLLRRLKTEVAKDLPAKIEQVTWCELTGEQQAVYQEILAQGRRDVFAAKKESDQRLAVLTALLRLRQASCHLGLLPAEREWQEPSAKLETCLELIEEATSGGHRVLVFSQFVKLLKLVQAALPLPHCYLDGSTTDRAAEIRRFQESDTPVFLISLKAGGTGLNLTGADTVIHLDPWWNPAIEDQATARAHRIGQQQVVTSYKLIARGTVEEKIIRLQERKRELTDKLITSDEAFVQMLSGEELRALLE